MSGARAFCAAALLAALPALAEERRFALVVGDAQGGVGTRPLRYAERDARRMHAILTRLGGVRPEDARLLTAASADEVRRALADLAARADQAKARGEETVLVVYYSGHAKEGELRLGDTRMPLVELRDALRNAPADVRIGLLDSCQSGAITRPKGIRAAPAFDVQQAQAASTRPRGLVLIASSSADEESQESDEIGASFFTHYLASGLLGDADPSGDGKVTLAEAYTHAYARTDGEPAEARRGARSRRRDLPIPAGASWPPAAGSSSSTRRRATASFHRPCWRGRRWRCGTISGTTSPGDWISRWAEGRRR